MKKTFLSIILVLSFISSSHAATYTIGSDASDDYATFVAFNAAINPTDGDIISWRGGETFFEKVTLDFGGTASAITLTSHGTGKAKLSGASTLGSWTGPDGNGEYYIAIPSDIEGTSLIEFLLKNGVPVPRATDDAQGTLSSGYWTYDSVGGNIYYKPDAGMTHIFESAYGHILELDGYNYITIDNLHFYGGNNGVLSTVADDTNGSTNITVKNCLFENFSAHGFWLFSGKTIVVGENLGGVTSQSAFSNEFRYCQKGAVKLGTAIGGGPSNDHDVDGAIVRCNYFHHNAYIDVAYSFEGHVIDVNPYGSEIDVIENLFYENGYVSGQIYTAALSAGTIVSVDGVDNSDIVRNIFLNNYQGCIVFGPDTNVQSSGYLISTNLFVNNGRATVDSGTRSNKLRIIESKNAFGSASNLNAQILNNTFVDNRGNIGTINNGAANIWLAGLSDISGITVKNNVHDANQNKADFRVYTENGAVTYTEDYNCYYRSSGDYLGLGNIAATTLYPSTNSFTDFKTATGGSNSLNDDPLLSLTHRPLNKNVPIVDAGELQSIHVIGWKDIAGRTRLYGSGVDIGAYETWQGTYLKPNKVFLLIGNTADWYTP